MFGEILTAVLSAFVIGIAVMLVSGWFYTVKAMPTAGFWEKLRSGAGDSATILHSYAVVIGTWVLALLENSSTILGQGELHDWLVAHLSPNGVGAVLLIVAVGSFLSRLRTL